MGFARSQIDPCLYYKWSDTGLTVWLSWIDDCMVWGARDNIDKAADDFARHFDSDDVGELNEYVGCKVDHDVEGRTIKFTQPVLLRSFKDEFNLPKEKERVTPAEPGSILVQADESYKVDPKRHKYYRSGVGKLLYLMRWSRPDIMNAVRELYTMKLMRKQCIEL